MKSYTEHINYTEFCPFGPAIPTGPLEMYITTLNGLSIYGLHKRMNLVGKKIYFFNEFSSRNCGEAIIEKVNSNNKIILERGSLINYIPSHYDIKIIEDISNEYETKFPLTRINHYYGCLFNITPNLGTVTISHDLGYPYYTNKLNVHALLKISFDLERDIEVKDGFEEYIGKEYLADTYMSNRQLIYDSASININLARAWNSDIITFPNFSVPISPYPLCNYTQDNIEIIIGNFLYTRYTQKTFYLQLTYDHEFFEFGWLHHRETHVFNRVIRIKNLKVSVLLPTLDGEFEEMKPGEALSILAIGGTHPSRHTAVGDLLL